MGNFDLFGRHFLSDLFLRYSAIGIPADRRQCVPGIGPNEIGSRHAAAGLIIPGHACLGAGVAFHRGAQVPVERAPVIAFNAKSERVHDANQLFGIRISRSGCGKQFAHGRFVFACLHQVASLLDFGMCRIGDKQEERKQHNTHGMAFLLCLILLAFAPVLQAIGGERRARPPEPLGPADFHVFDDDKARIGRLLFYDSILSGNRNISCGTCHHHSLASADGLSLGIGEGGAGIGRDRTTGTGPNRIRERMPRNTPALFNLGAREISVLFNDGRLGISDDYGNGFNSPAEEWLPQGLDNILAAFSIFPMISPFEMAGDPRENRVAVAAHDRFDRVWPLIAKRVRIIPEYAAMFVRAFDEVSEPIDIGISHIANALGAFIGSEWVSHDSAFDAYLKGDVEALEPAARRGLDLFYGKAGCNACHSGKLLTDQDFHSLGLPQFGPGRTRPFDPSTRDVGRMAETDRIEDAFRFRTPSLRNVALTAPYGHNGAYPTLRGIIRHHLDPVTALAVWDKSVARLPDADWLAPFDFVAMDDRRQVSWLRASIDIEPVALDENEIDDLVAFLETLTGTKSVAGRLGRPEAVPSGLKVD